MNILFITALKEESRRIRTIDPPISETRPTPQSRLFHLQSGTLLLQGGMGLKRMQDSLAALPEELTVEAALVVGVSGSVSPQLAIGEFIQPDSYLGPEQVTASPDDWEPLWLDSLKLLQHVVTGPLLSCVDPVATIEDRDAAAETGALAVDMESFEVANFCISRGLPLLTLRIISDQAGGEAFEEFKKHFPVVATKLQDLLIPFLYPNHAD